MGVQKRKKKSRYQKIEKPTKKKKKIPVIVDSKARKPFLSFFTEDNLRTIGLVPFLLMIAFVPLIIYAKVLTLSPLEEINWFSGAFYIDFFAYYKSVAFVILTLIGFTYTIVLLIAKRIPFRNSIIFIPMATYIILTLLSSFFAIDKTIVTRGFPEMHQGTIVLITYMIVIFTVFQLVKNNNHIKMLIFGFLFVGVVVGILGFYQYFGRDLLSTEKMILFFLPRELESLASEFRVRFGQFNVYATMGNTNFVGSFAALMIPLSFSLYFYAKKWIFKLFFFVFASLTIFIGFGSNSRAGFIGIAISLFLVVAFFRKEFVKRPISSIVPFATLIVVGIGLNLITDGMIHREIQSMNIFNEIEKINQENEGKVRFERIITDGFSVLIETTTETLIIEKKGYEVFFYDGEQSPLNPIISGNRYQIDDEGYENYQITMDASGAFFDLRAYNKTFRVFHMIDGLKLIGLNGELVDAVDVNRLELLKGYEKLFSSRAYIWSVSIPMLKDYIWIGAGPDMYPIAFNQNDFVGIANGYMTNTIVDKPHNMYIQIGINTGILSLLALFAAFIVVIVKLSISTFKSKGEDLSDYFSVGVLAALIAYLATSFFNDQMISIAPLFYICLGLGLAIVENRKKSSTIIDKEINY